MTTAEFEKKKADYVAKYGYSVTVPGLSDIIKIGIEKPITQQEEIDYKKKDWKAFSPERLEDIRKMKQKRKDRFLAMLASPTPAIFRNAGSILTSMDDCQDALSTLTWIGRVALKIAPRIIGKILAGPVGWLMTAADIINLVQALGRVGTTGLFTKRTKDGATGHNPFTKKAKARRALKLGKAMPTKGDIIEALQTTDQIFGVGLCLGPIVGLASDIFFGGVRTTFKDPPKIKIPTPDFPHWTRVAQKTAKAVGFFFGGLHYTDDDMLLEAYMAGYLANQELTHFQHEWNPLDTVEDPQDLDCRAPIPTNVLTLEVIQEEKIPIEEICGWPHNDQLWANITEISDATQGPITENLRAFMTRNQHNWYGYTAGALASETALNSLVNLEGEEQISYDYTVQSKIASKLLQNQYYPDPDQPAEKLREFTNYMDYCERTNYNPRFGDVKWFCQMKKIQLLTFP